MNDTTDAERRHKANAASARYRAKNLEKVREQQRDYRMQNPEKIREIRRKSRAKHPETQRAYAKRYRLKNKDKLLEKIRKWREDNPHRVEFLWRRLEARKEAERIAIAGRPRPDTCEVCGRSGKIVFDHCHKNGHFRGWLCDNCNVVLGRVDDDPSILRKLIAYLERDFMTSELPLFAQQS